MLNFATEFITTEQRMKSRDLTQGNILGNIVTFSLPYILAYFLQILYGLADLFVIGQYCDVDATTSVSNGTQVMYLITCVLIGLAMGTTVHTARAIGAKDQRRAARVIGNTVTLFLGIAVILAIVLLCCRDSIITLIDTPVEAIAGTKSYLTLCFIGIPFIVAYNIIASIFRGLGDSKSPMYFVAVACVMNILLDYFFIGFMGLGPMGAALGTVLSQLISVLFALASIRRHKEVFSVTRQDFKPDADTLKGLLKIGVPICMQDGFVQVGFLLIMVIANSRGVVDAAAVGIVEKFIGLVFIVNSAMLATVSAIASQNIGAGNVARAQQTMWRAMMIVIGYGLVVSITLQFVPQLAVGIFTDDPQVLTQGSDYLRGYVWDCVFAGIHFCFSGFFTACGYSIISFIHNFLSISLVRVPFAYLASEAYPYTLYPMGLVTWLGSLFSCLICVGVYCWMLKHKKFQVPK